MQIDKKLLFAAWAGENKYFSTYQTFYGPLKKIFNNIIMFDPQKNIYKYGQEGMNRRFLELVQKEKPDYIFFLISYDEFYVETLLKIKEISPKTITINYFGDDDTQLDNFTRYYSLIFDYCLVLPHLRKDVYIKEGMNNVFFISGTNLDHFRSLELKKEFDVTFIGTPKSDRYDIIRYLLEKGVKIKLFGSGWYKYNDLKEVYCGPINENELIDIMNKSKINLCLTKNDYCNPHLKGRFFEIGACKSFALVEYCPRFLDFFEEGKEIISFKNRKDLLKKIGYYIKNEKERGRIALNTYNKILKNNDLHKELVKFFKDVNKERLNKLPVLTDQIYYILKEDFNNHVKLNSKLKNINYIGFDNNCHFSRYKDYFQAYSLERYRKDISCCDYYMSEVKIGDYLGFPSKFVYKKIGKEKIAPLMDLGQLMVTKGYFIKNINVFKEVFHGNKIDFINEKNTAFVSIPLVKVYAPKKIDYNIFREVLWHYAKFTDNLAYLTAQRKLFRSKYFYDLILKSLTPRRFFILRYLFASLFNKNKILTLKRVYNQRSNP